MKKGTISILTAAFLMLSVQSAFAGKLVGYNFVFVPAQTDVRLSVPFTQDAEGEFMVTSKTSNSVTVADTLAVGAFNNTHYVRFINGDGEGLWSTISQNGANDFVLTNINVLSFVNVGDKFRVYQHETLASMFPDKLRNASFTDASSILIFKNALGSLDQNRSADFTAFYMNGDWTGSGVNNDTILEPETQFILRNSSDQTLKVVTKGTAPDYSVSALIGANGDVVMGSGYPVHVTLNESGLGGDNRAVLFFNNIKNGQNKSAAATAFSLGGSWQGTAISDGDQPIPPSQTITLRLPASESQTKVTVNKPY